MKKYKNSFDGIKKTLINPASQRGMKEVVLATVQRRSVFTSRKGAISFAVLDLQKKLKIKNQRTL